MAATKEEIIEAIKEMPALELSELVHELEDVFGVSAAAPVAVAAAPPAGAAARLKRSIVSLYSANRQPQGRRVRKFKKRLKDLASAARHNAF